MIRREFIAGLGGAAAWPLAGHAQQRSVPVIGYLDLASDPPTNEDPFFQGLTQAGYVGGQNLAIAFRGANFRPSVFPQLAADLVASNVAVIVTAGSPYAAIAAKAATTTTPIVFLLNEDPIVYGLVASFNRPGGNVTGVTLLTAELMPKRLSFLLELAPKRPRSVISVLQTLQLPRPG
jgi:putative tryptophan/tyrosine transport system substrate-binding protein